MSSWNTLQLLTVATNKIMPEKYLFLWVALRCISVHPVRKRTASCVYTIRLLISTSHSSSFCNAQRCITGKRFFYVCESSLLETSKILCYIYVPSRYVCVTVSLLLGAKRCFKTNQQIRVWNSYTWSASAFLKTPVIRSSGMCATVSEYKYVFILHFHKHG